jgi:hypothetical protein
MARWQAGEDMRPRARKARADGAAPAVRKAPGLRLPAGKMWLTKILQPVAWQVLQWSSAVTQLLDDPEMQALVEVAPQAGRLLRPLCRLFEMEVPAYLRLPRAPKAPRPRRKRAPKPLEPRPAKIRQLTRREIDGMTAAELVAHYGRLPPHFPLPFRNLNHVRRRIAAG